MLWFGLRGSVILCKIVRYGWEVPSVCMHCGFLIKLDPLINFNLNFNLNLSSNICLPPPAWNQIGATD